MASKSSNDDDSSVCQSKSALFNCKNKTESHNGATEEEDLVGNVSKFIAYPPNSSGKAQRGYLMFHACFQSGNLGRVDCISEFEYDLFIRPDTCNPRFRVWFNFTVQNVRSGQKVIFNIVNFSKTKSLYREGMSPLVKSTSRPRWQRIPAKNVFYYKSPEHNRNYVMSFAFAFDREADVYQFSYCFPYTYNKLQLYLNDIENMNLDYIKRNQLCLSVQQRNVDLLTITSPKNLKGDKKRRVVFFTARVHPGESPSSYVCQGIIDFLISNHPVAQVLREHLVFMVVPMLNPDGVVLGNYRCSLMGFDLNRYWLEPSPWAHPSIVATKQLLLQMNSDPMVSLDFCIDIHAHSTAMNGFMYGNVYEDEERFEQHSVFPRLLASHADDFSFSSTSFNKDTVKSGTSRRTLGLCLSDRCNCYTLEVSFYSYSSGCSTAVPYTEESYLKLGRNVARTFVDYYKLNNFAAQKLRKNFLGYDKVRSRVSNEKNDHQDSETIETRSSNEESQSQRNSWKVPKKTFCINDDHILNNHNYIYGKLKLKHRNSKT